MFLPQASEKQNSLSSLVRSWLILTQRIGTKKNSIMKGSLDFLITNSDGRNI